VRLLLLAGMVLLVACGDDSSGPDDGVDIEGTWTWSAEISNVEFELTCDASGDAIIEQSGSQFTGQIVNGTGSCSGPGGSQPFDPNGAIGGVIDDDNVELSDDFCEYTGVATGNPVTEVDGNVTCVFPTDEEDIQMTGTWQMNR
jgi:hypothetical protein